MLALEALAPRRGRLARSAACAAAAGLLAVLAGCGTARTGEPAPTTLPTPTEQATVSATSASTPATSRATTSQPDPGSSAGSAPASEGSESGAGEPGASTPVPTPVVPESWAGTAVVQSNWPQTELPRPSMLFGEVLYEGQTRLEANELSQLESTSTITIDGAPYTTQCNEPVNMAQGAISCSLSGADPTATEVQILLAPAPYAHSQLLVRVPAPDTPPITLPTGSPIIMAFVLDEDFQAPVEPSQITQQDIETAAVEGALLSLQGDGELPETLPVADCDLGIDGLTAMCTITGTPSGGADGVWQGAIRSGYDGRPVLLMARLPGS